ncbi:C4b-binding protein beta chain isoform X2 [Ornithorhynchus anatinus]|uniref:C4b-binding protein beta chain isoform X2 n=1 Tax=Ornithorhynchus anatinus TaxID=9258 RepID=UPI0010A7BC13|nr:C4b-binding protein beta chain isoform X2 [Ornithorhynchus anatinus]
MNFWLVSYIGAIWLLIPSVGGICPEPLAANHSILIVLEKEDETWVTYSCTKGYHLVGKKTLFCNASHKWDRPAPSCLPGHCPNPLVANGQRSPPEQGPVAEQETVSFTCDDGYVLKGSGSSQCLENHTWSPPLPTCRTTNCPSPKKPAHGQFTANDLTSGSTVTYHCEEGFQLVGRLSRKCVDGEWSGEEPICEEACVAHTQALLQLKRNICEVVKEGIQLQKCQPRWEELKSSLEIKKLHLENEKLQLERS